MATWYRFEDYLSADDWGSYVNVRLRTFEVIKETPKGVWLRLYEFTNMKRFVRNDSRKKFACPTREQALESFLARKTKQAKILKAQLRRVEEAIQIAKQQDARRPILSLT